jgi:hypothetical protein
LLLTVAAVLLLSGSAALGASKGANLRGTWICCGAGGAGSQDFIISSSGAGAIRGIAKQPGGVVFANITGSLSGNSVSIVTTYTTIDPGYVATFTGRVSASDRSISGSWVSNANQSGTWTAIRAGKAPAPTKPTAPASTDQTGCVGPCVDMSYAVEPTLDPDPEEIEVGTGCGGASADRTTSSALRASFLSSCIENLALYPSDTTAPADLPAVGVLIDAQAQQMQRWQILQQTQNQINAIQQNLAQPATAPATDAAKSYQKWQDYLNGTPPATNAAPLSSTDTSLAPDFPTTTQADTRRLASGQSVTAAAANSSAVLRSVYMTKPTATDIRAFNSDLKLATAPVYSPARAVARLTLVVAFTIGDSVLKRELGYDPLTSKGSGKPLVLAVASGRVADKGKHRFTLRPNALGGRVLRLLSIYGLSHKTDIHLSLSVKRKGVTHHKSLPLRIR